MSALGEFKIGFTTPAIVFGNGKLPGAEVLEVFYEKADYSEIKGSNEKVKSPEESTKEPTGEEVEEK